MLGENKKISADKRALDIIKNHHGFILTSQAIKLGIHPRTLYSLRDKGIIEQISRGFFGLSELDSISNPDIVAASIRIPQGVICLVSSLSFHNLTTQIPYHVFIALEKGAETPRMKYPPLSIHRFSKPAFKAGIEIHKISGVDFRIYNPEKTLADCFKFRNKLGMDVVVEALKLYREVREFKVDEIMKFARICRVANIMKPYLEALL